MINHLDLDDSLQSIQIDWHVLLFIMFTHSIGFFGTLYLILYQQVPWQTWLLAGILFCLGGLANSIGYHRLFAHRSFKSSWPLKFFLLLIAPINGQNSALKWCADHRRHHAHTDTDQDPYNATNGFFYCHIGWLLLKQINDPTVLSDRSRPWQLLNNVSDLQQDKLIALQHRLFLPLVILMGFLLPTAIAASWHDAIGGLIIAGFARMSLYFQCTCLINSACHYWGTQPYTRENSAKNNWLAALLTFGEGFHNYHHAFPFDYRNGIKWYQWDPSKWAITLFSWLKLASGLRAASSAEIAAMVKTNQD